MWSLMFCISKLKYLSLKQLSAQFLLFDLEFLDLYLSPVFISRIHAFKHLFLISTMAFQSPIKENGFFSKRISKSRNKHTEMKGIT